MTKECLWYNGEEECYELLDFDPNGLTNPEIIAKAKKILGDRYCLDADGLNRIMSTLYLLDIEHLEQLEDKMFDNEEEEIENEEE